MAQYGLLASTLMGRPQSFSGGGSLAELLMQSGLPMGGGMGGGQFPPAPQMQPQMPQQSSGGGFLDSLLSPEVALPMAGRLIAGPSSGQGIGEALAFGGEAIGKIGERRKAEAEQNRSLQILNQMRPDLAQLVSAGMPMSEAWNNMLTGGQGKPTDDMREYQQAVQQGFQGNFMDYQIKMKEAGRNQIDINTGEKLPTGFRWKNPEQKELGVEPIPGGPGEQVPAELAARVGMADNFLSQLPKIKADVAAGKVTGLVDKTGAATGYGGGAQTYRQIQSGVDALTRMLSGAGMNITEAEQYARRYLPTYADDSQSMLTKLEQLEAELLSTKEMTMRGRGGSSTGDMGNDPLGILGP